MNYAEEVQVEANHIARRKLGLAISPEEGLEAVLVELARIHAERMAQAAEWRAPSTSRMSYAPLTAAMVNTQVVYGTALALMKEAAAAVFSPQETTNA